ncbi:MAG: methyltransferase domain-containing protein [archaeon]
MDIYHNIEEGLPFEDNTFDYVFADNVLEHVKNIFFILDEINRICKNGAIIEIYVPHYSGMYSLKHLAHYRYYGVCSFDMLCGETFAGEKYNKTEFKLLDEKLPFWAHDSGKFKLIYKLFPDYIFNLNNLWQRLLEMFFIFGFDERYCKLKVVRD